MSSSAALRHPPSADEHTAGTLLALGVHALLVAGLAVGVSWRSHEVTPLSAELWAAVPRVAAPEPAPPPPPPPPEVIKPKVEAPPPAPPKAEEPEAQIVTEKKPVAPKPTPDEKLAEEKAQAQAREAERRKKEDARKQEEARQRQEQARVERQREENLSAWRRSCRAVRPPHRPAPTRAAQHRRPAMQAGCGHAFFPTSGSRMS
jgi:colicin import membrane protein